MKTQWESFQRVQLSTAFNSVFGQKNCPGKLSLLHFQNNDLCFSDGSQLSSRILLFQSDPAEAVEYFRGIKKALHMLACWSDPKWGTHGRKRLHRKFSDGFGQSLEVCSEVFGRFLGEVFTNTMSKNNSAMQKLIRQMKKVVNWGAVKHASFALRSDKMARAWRCRKKLSGCQLAVVYVCFEIMLFEALYEVLWVCPGCVELFVSWLVCYHLLFDQVAILSHQTVHSAISCAHKMIVATVSAVDLFVFYLTRHHRDAMTRCCSRMKSTSLPDLPKPTTVGSLIQLKIICFWTWFVQQKNKC